MADFCYQCTEAFLGIPGEKNDLNGLVPEGDLLHTLCEGCGPCVVNSKGVCVGDCIEHHGKATCCTLKQYVKGDSPS